MTRKELTEEVLNCKAPHYIFCLATGSGKTALCLKKIASLYPRKRPKILIVVPRNVLKGATKNKKGEKIKKTGWTEEFYKWKLGAYYKNTTMTTYASLHKYVGKWDCIVLDEAHHTTERCRKLLALCETDHLFALSATLKREHRWFLGSSYKGIREFNVTIQDAIKDGILPEPKIALLPIKLNDTAQMAFEFKIPSENKCQQKPILVQFADRFKYIRYPGKVYVQCTQKQYSNDLDNTIDRAVTRGDSKTAKLVGGRRVKWLAQQKEPYVRWLMEVLYTYRTLTFCGSVANAEALGYPRIDSKIGDDNLHRFNNKEFNHLCCVEKLDEGSNLTDCKIGIFQIINTSSRISIQRAGRIYRHKHPILIFPYFEGSNDVKALKMFLEGYNKEYITTVKTKEELIRLIEQ